MARKRFASCIALFVQACVCLSASADGKQGCITTGYTAVAQGVQMVHAGVPSASSSYLACGDGPQDDTAVQLTWWLCICTGWSQALAQTTTG